LVNPTLQPSRIKGQPSISPAGQRSSACGSVASKTAKMLLVMQAYPAGENLRG
jgi:hypothetical protein